jgi:hypothetical protein
MLENVTVFLLVLWVLGLVSSHTMGGLIHLFLVMAVAVTVIRIFQGLRRLPGQVTRSGDSRFLPLPGFPVINGENTRVYLLEKMR